MVRIPAALCGIVLAFGLANSADAQLRYMGWEDVGYDHRDASIDCQSPPERNTLVISFEAPHDMTDLRRIVGYLDFCTLPHDLPEWWRFDQPGCRQGGLSLSTNFRNGPSTHLDPWQGEAISLFRFEPNYRDKPFLARVLFDITPAVGDSVPIEPGREHYALKIVFTNPDFECDGCATPACLVLNGMVLYHSGGEVYTGMDYSNWATWQGGPFDCPFIVPARETSWGRLKAIYR